MSIFEFLYWLINNWLLILWGASILIGYIYGGKTLALSIFTLGFGLISYRKGKSDKSEHIQEVERKRDEAFKEIEDRVITRADVVDRLHRGKF